MIFWYLINYTFDELIMSLMKLTRWREVSSWRSRKPILNRRCARDRVRPIRYWPASDHGKRRTACAYVPSLPERIQTRQSRSTQDRCYVTESHLGSPLRHRSASLARWRHRAATSGSAGHHRSSGRARSTTCRTYGTRTSCTRWMDSQPVST